MLTFLVVVSFFFLSSLIFSSIFKLNGIQLLPTTIFFTMIWLTIFGVFNQLNFGFFLIYPFMVSCLFILIVRDRRNLKKRITNYISPAGATFFGLCLLTFFLSRNMQFVEWDEFTHWGFIVKISFLFDVLGPLSPAHVTIPSNLPGLSVLSYAVVKIGGNWTEGDIFWAYHLLIISLICGPLWKYKWFEFKKFLLSFSLILISSVMFFNSFNTVYADPILGLTFGYLIYLATDLDLPAKKSLQFNFLIILTGFILVKELAIALAVIPIVIALVNIYFYELRNQLSTSKILAHLFLKFGILISGPLFIRFIWTDFISLSGSSVSNSVSGALAGSNQRFQALLFSENSQEVVQSVFSKFRTSELTLWNGISLTGFEWAIIFCVFLLVINLDLRKVEIVNLLLLSTSLIIILGFTYYLLVLSAAYLTVYSGASQESLTSFERYLSAYPAGIIFFLALISAEMYRKNKDNNSYRKHKSLSSSGVYLLTLLFLFNSAVFRVTNFVVKPNEYSTVFRSQFLDLKQKIVSGKFTQNDNFWIIAQHTVGFENYLFQYELLPASVGFFPFSIGSPSDESDIWTEKTMDVSAWEKALIENEIDYVLVVKSTESFKNEFGTIFENPDSLLQGNGIYKVNVKDSQVLLTNYR